MMDLHEAIVPKLEWVRTVNADRFGEHCVISEGSRVMLIAEHCDRYGDRVLVRYAPVLDPKGTECMRGDIFWLDKKRFESMTDEYRHAIEAREKEKAIVADLLARDKSRKP